MKKNNTLILIVLFVTIVAIGFMCFSFVDTKPATATFFRQNTSRKDTVLTCFSSNASFHREEKKSFSDSFSQLIFANRLKTLNTQVFLGGQAIGMSFDKEGAVVIGLNEFLSNEGLVSPAMESDIAIGDVIIEIDGKKICNSSELTEILQTIGERTVSIKCMRGSVLEEKTVTLKYDIISKTYKLGLWVKDAGSGIGTVSFILQNGKFASLGHPVIDSKTGKIIQANGGGIYTCKILSIQKGVKGSAGELRGVIDGQNKIGEIYQNNNFGVYGKFYESQTQLDYKQRSIEIASTDEVVPGKATIVCTLEKGEPKEYEIEIIKPSAQNNVQEKGLIIRITDKRLIDLCGGIVQGMSGSPIIQNNKLVGAVTHVFVNDPTKGYGIYSEWMLETLNDLSK